MDVLKEATIESRHDGKQLPYRIIHERDQRQLLRMCMTIDSGWSAFNGWLCARIKEEAGEDLDLLKRRFEECKLGDSHWKWSDKALQLASDEYEWFFLETEPEIEGAAVIFHPKPSRLEEHSIFYVDYLAVAPWNRKTPYSEKKLGRVGTVLLQSALRYSVDVLGYAAGFSLHSLPQTETYYRDIIRMDDFGIDSDKKMRFFEMSEPNSRSLMEIEL